MNTYTLGKVNVDAVVIYQDPRHLEIRLLAILLVFIFDESILQAVARSFVPYHFTGHNGPETAENEVKVFVCKSLS